MAQVQTAVPGLMPQAAPGSAMNPEFVQFKEIEHDFGYVKLNNPPMHAFQFKNVGNRDITLVNVQASCGCTTPNWKGGIYKPDSVGYIKATFNAASEGYFNKIITVTTSEGVVTLTIKGTVLSPAAYDKWKHTDDSIKAATEAAKKPVKKSGKAKKTKKVKKDKTNADANKPKSAGQKQS